jgi:hypothetical protein
VSETDADREFFDEVERLADRAVTALFQRARLRRIAQLEEALREEREEPRLRLINGGGGP